uniref:Uncharacterized protein n=1 Tax=Molossus molossus TaxID=27622 RepID=A0A7J8GNF4_MOLMO|nr:hypothetical protein HJG59_002991 [Molossus molossus]
MNDEDYSTTYDTVQKEREYEVPDQPAENEGAIYDKVHEELMSENTLYVNELQTHEYDSVSVYAVGSEENSLAFIQPEAEDYLLPDEVYSEAQDPQPGEPQEDGDILMEELHSPTQDQEMSPEEPQQNRSRMLPPPSFTVQESSDDSPTCYSADDGFDDSKSPSMNPEINLFMKPIIIIILSTRTIICKFGKELISPEMNLSLVLKQTEVGEKELLASPVGTSDRKNSGG